MSASSPSYKWERLEALNTPCPRSSHQLSSLGSKVYLFGGENGPLNSHFGYGLPVPSSTVKYLDLDQPQDGWKQLTATGGNPPPSPRLGHGQCIVVEEERSYLYVFGGRQPIDGDLDNIRSLNDLNRMDLESGVWEQIQDSTGDIPSPRSYHQMVPCTGTNIIYVFAGMINDTRYNDLYKYDTKQNHWTRLSICDEIIGRGGPGLCALNGKDGNDISLVVVAGFCGKPMSDVWQYYIAKDQWMQRKDWTLPVPRSIFACGTLSEEEIITFGGELENFDSTLIEQGRDPTLQASLYTNETLVLYSSAGKDGSSDDNTCTSSSVRVLDFRSGDKNIPPARGWTAGCSATVGGKPCFAVFGGVREGHKGSNEASGIRLDDFWILKRN